MSWEHAAEARAALNSIVNDPEHGVSALSSAQTMSNLLKDLLPDAPREKSILVAAAEAGLAGTLRDHVNHGMDASTAIRLTASSFSSTTPFTPEACNWVTGEIAGALGISAPGSPSGGFGGTPSSFDPIGGQGAPTQMAPIPGSGQGGFGQGGAGTGGSGGGFDPGATAPGAWQQQQPQQPPQQQGGGFGAGAAGAAGAGFGAGAAGGFGQGGGVAGQPTTAWQPPGQQQAGGFGQQAQGGWQPAQGGGAWQPQGGGFGQGPTFGPGGAGGSGGSKRGLWIGVGVVAVIIVIVIVAVSLSGGGKKTPTGGGGGTPVTTPPTTPPQTSPASTPPPTTGIQPLATIMNDPSHPVGTNCTDTPPLFGLKASTVLARRFCAKTDKADVIVWGYQFDNAADYQAGYDHIRSFTGFNNNTPAKGCPPPSGSSEGTIGWHALHNARYKSRTGQDLNCFMNGTKPRPTLIWSMPSQHVFFIAKDTSATSTIKTIVNWWDDVAYAP